MVVRLASDAAHSHRYWKTTFPSDEEIVGRVIAGEVALFEVLMRRHNQRVYRTIRAILKDEPEIEDIMQQTYASAYGSLRQFVGTAKFSTWLTRIAINEALARRGRAAHFISSQDPVHAGNDMSMQLASEDGNPEEQAAGRELTSMLEAAIDALPDSFRSVVMLRAVEELSTAEAAEVLGVTEEVVKTRLHRAKESIRDLLVERMNAHAGEAFRFYAPRCDRVVAQVFARIQGMAIT
jgi:RNA polymerase sigma-70 factor, ECF subfamily